MARPSIRSAPEAMRAKLAMSEMNVSDWLSIYGVTFDIAGGSVKDDPGGACGVLYVDFAGQCQ